MILLCFQVFFYYCMPFNMIFSSVTRAKLYRKHSLQRLNIFLRNHNTPPVVHLNPVTWGSCKQCPVVLGAWKNKTVKKNKIICV